jgi:major intracellular serine protease
MKNNCKLLPFIREDLFGVNTNSKQFYGWEINKFNIPELWKKSEGEGIKVAVIDTGCDIYHDDLKNNLLIGINLLDKNKDPIDDNGHGTHVCGTIAAENNDRGMVGIAPKTKIIPIKALDGSGSGNNQTISEGIIWAINAGCDFIGMSLGCPEESIDLKNAISYAVKRGVIVFCAAGNAGENHDIMYPAKDENTISIGAIDSNLNRTNFTCSGEELDFLCPGNDIISCIPGNNYAKMSGTSMSNPFAIGCACLLASFYRKNGKKIKTAKEYIEIFKKNTRDLQNPKYAGKKKYQGYGILYPTL